MRRTVAGDEIDKETYFIIKSGKWEDEDGESGTYKKKGDKVVFYITFFGETEELCDGTLKNGVLIVNDDIYISQKHKHKYGDWETTREATCTLEGVQIRTCACGVSETQKLPITEHNFGAWVVMKQATCTEEGNKRRICTACGNEENQTIEIKAHKMSGWQYSYDNHFKNCTVCGARFE